MENLTMDFERIEQELQELRSRFSRADVVLSDLEEIQIQFEDLAEIHKQLKEDVKKHVSEFSRFNAESTDIIKLLQQSQKDFEQRFTQLRDANQIKIDDMKSQLLEYQDRLSIHDSHIQALQSSMSLVEKNCHDIKNDLGGLPKQIQYLVDQQLSSTQQAYCDLKKQIRIMRYALIFVILFLLIVAWVGLK
ncbi:hypothetical protein [Coleofasciculus sp. FACHB-129]|uniref:hypothetical protein n=1 Tax=Cyanophyceae TaxID=3028117 RepID=UPI001685D684|nr:hypothetical protein [Coleofasciculus sp. FACHB-129]MBD1895515.1 hypothetical protein [Coleofasciculus sp. FACHB-129]